MRIQLGHRLGHWKRYACCIMLTVFHYLATSAIGFSQQVTLRVNDARLEQVLESIRTQTGYSFIFDARFAKSALPVTVNLKDEPLEGALRQVFKGQPFTYEVNDKIVTVLAANKVAVVTLSGRIVSPDNQPIIGATIVVQ